LYILYFIYSTLYTMYYLLGTILVKVTLKGPIDPITGIVVNLQDLKLAMQVTAFTPLFV